MAKRTSYLSLIKPDYADAADIADLNANMDTLDTTIKELDETGSKSLTSHDNNADAHAALATTINALMKPSSDTDTVRNLLSFLANRYKVTAGVDDWKTDPATTLSALHSFVSNCASGSDVTWSGKKFANAKLGISGLMDTNGYVSFGPNFGGLIIQWVKVNMTGKTSYKVTPPLDFTCFAGCVTDNGSGRYSYGFSPGDLICYGSGITGISNCHIIMTGVA